MKKRRYTAEKSRRHATAHACGGRLPGLLQRIQVSLLIDFLNLFSAQFLQLGHEIVKLFKRTNIGHKLQGFSGNLFGQPMAIRCVTW